MPAEAETRTITVETARAAVLASGELEALEGPHFRVGRGEWDSVFIADDEVKHPDFARVLITRRGQARREVIIGWADYSEIIEDAADPQRADREREWGDTRSRKPMSIFGAEAERHAYRVVFADVITGLRAEAAPHEAMPRDWMAEFEAAETAEALEDAGKWARAARAFTPDAEGTRLHLAFREKRRRLLDAEAQPATEQEDVGSAFPIGDPWAPEAPELSDAERAQHRAFFGAERPGVAQPLDHQPPANRAARRAKQRRKGRR